MPPGPMTPKEPFRMGCDTPGRASPSLMRARMPPRRHGDEQIDGGDTHRRVFVLRRSVRKSILDPAESLRRVTALNETGEGWGKGVC
jgi:hypothetical protein